MRTRLSTFVLTVALLVFAPPAYAEDANDMGWDGFGVGTMIQWGGQALHHHRELGLDVSLPVTDRYFEHCLLLPMNTALSNADVDRICELVVGHFATA